MDLLEYSSKREFDRDWRRVRRFKEASAAIESTLDRDRDRFSADGYCINCNAVRPLTVDYSYSGRDGRRTLTPNYREHLRCVDCGLCNRMRACLYVFKYSLRYNFTARVYASEQATSFFRALRQHYPYAVGSEFLPSVPRGSVNSDGVRCEDLTQLTFPDAQFDAVLTFECLEHIPDYRAALAECRRVLRPGGTMLLTTPFYVDLAETRVRALRLADGTVRHLLEPEYHGDPLATTGEGILSYYDFGWSLLDDIRAAGFASATAGLYLSVLLGHFGTLLPIVVAKA